MARAKRGMAGREPSADSVGRRSRPGSRAGSLRASRSGSLAGSRRLGSGASSSGGSRRGSIASVASSVRSSIDSFAMGAMGIGAEDREIIAQEEQAGARPVTLGRGAARRLTCRVPCARSAVPAGDSPICSDMVLQMLLYFHVYFSLIWFAMYWYLWDWKVSTSHLASPLACVDCLSGCLPRWGALSISSQQGVPSAEPASRGRCRAG